MPLSPNEIKDRALAFAREWADERAERAEAQTFWNEFFTIFGVNGRRGINTDSARVAFLFDLYREYTQPLLPPSPSKPSRHARST